MTDNRKITLFFAKILPIVLLFIISLIQWSYAVKSNLGKTLPLIVIVVEAITLFILASTVLIIIYRLGSKLKSNLSRVFLTTLFYLFALIANLISKTVRDITGYESFRIDSYFFIQSLNFFFPLILVVVVYALVRNRMDLALEREKKLKAENLVQQARWMMLRYQVNPHFLFNALNTIRALIGNDDEKARKIVTEMSEYFRYSLSVEKKTLVTIQEEISAVKSYLEIQSIRFKDRLIVKTQIDEGLIKSQIPAFTIQTLAENAVKYGLKTSEDIIKVEINVIEENSRVKIIVRNTGNLIMHDDLTRSEEGTQTGLENLKERLAYIDSGFHFSLEERNGMVEAIIIIDSKNLNHEAMESVNS